MPSLYAVGDTVFMIMYSVPKKCDSYESKLLMGQRNMNPVRKSVYVLFASQERLSRIRTLTTLPGSYEDGSIRMK